MWFGKRNTKIQYKFKSKEVNRCGREILKDNIVQWVTRIISENYKSMSLINECDQTLDVCHWTSIECERCTSRPIFNFHPWHKVKDASIFRRSLRNFIRHWSSRKTNSQHYYIYLRTFTLTYYKSIKSFSQNPYLKKIIKYYGIFWNFNQIPIL